MSPRDLALAAFAILVLGINVPVVKVIVGLAPPVFVTGLRFVLVGLVLSWFFPFPKRHWRQVVILSVVQGVLHHGIMFLGTAGVDATVAAIVLQLGSPFALIAAWLILHERFGPVRLAGMIGAFAGVLILVGEPAVWQANVSVMLLVVSSMAWALANIQIKKMGAVDALQMTVWMSVFAAPQLLVVSWVFETGQWDAVVSAPWIFWACLIYTALGATVIGYGLWYHLLRRYDVSQIVPFSLMQPVVGVLSSVLLLGDVLTANKVIGGIVVLIGVAVIQMRSRPT